MSLQKWQWGARQQDRFSTSSLVPQRSGETVIRGIIQNELYIERVRLKTPINIFK